MTFAMGTCFVFSFIFMGLACVALSSDEHAFSQVVCHIFFFVSGLLFGWGTWLAMKVMEA